MAKRVFFFQMICLLALFGCHDTANHGDDHGHEHGDDHGHEHPAPSTEGVSHEVDHGGAAEPGAEASISNDPAAMTVKAGCAMCIFGMEGVETCQLAAEIENRAYLVTGTAMMDHGDAHEENGMCTVARKAVVTGEVVDGKFAAEEFTLLPVS